MAITEQATETMNRNRVAGFALLGLVAVAAVALAVAYFSRPPQMGPDEDVFNTVDALYTAVRLKDAAKVGQCEDRLRAYREAGKLPKESAEYLDRVIAKARDGRWETATERLYEFMLAQRRDGAEESHHADKHQHKSVGVKGKK